MDMPQTTQPPRDTLASVRRLTASGMPEPQAEAVVYEQADLLNRNFATKADVEVLAQKVETVDAKIETVDGKVDAVKKDVETLNGKVETLDKKVDDVQKDVWKARSSGTFWMLLGTAGLVVALAGFMLAALK